MKRQQNNEHSLKLMAALVAAALATCGAAAAADSVVVVSPDGSNRAELTVGPLGPRLTIVRKGETVIAPSALGLMVLDGLHTRPLAPGGYALGKHQDSSGVDDYVQPVGKTSHVVAPYHQSEIALDAQGKDGGSLTLLVRAYDDGVAFRYVLPARPQGGTLAIQGEPPNSASPATTPAAA